jgi:hypothetical protein
MREVLKAHEEDAKFIRELFADTPKLSINDLIALDREKTRKANSLAAFRERDAAFRKKRRKRRPKAYVPEPRKPAPGEDPNDQSIAAIINRKLGTVKVRPPKLVTELTSEQLDAELKEAFTELARMA